MTPPPETIARLISALVAEELGRIRGRAVDPAEWRAWTPATRVDEVYCPEAPAAIDNSGTARAAAPHVVTRVRWAATQDYDAVLINRMLDPGLAAAQAAVGIPVLGLKQANTSVALLVGANPGIFDPEALTVAEYRRDPQHTYALLRDAGRRKVNFQGADVLVPNCAYLGGLAASLQEELGVPVLANRDIALRMLELVANYRLRPEAEWVDARRSRTKILLTRIYGIPLLGAVVFRVARLASRLR